MKPWENISFQKIKQASVDGGFMQVLFENGDDIKIKKDSFYPQRQDLDWDEIYFNSFEVVIPTFEDDEVYIPWDKIRVISDVEFSNFMASKAEEQAISVGRKLKALRTSRGIMSKELAERSGLTPQTITRIEKGKQDVNFKTLQKILAAMGYTLNDLAQLSLDENSKTFRKLVQKLNGAGLSRSLIIDRLIPNELLLKLSDIQRENPPLLLDEIALSIAKIFNWSIESIWSDSPLSVDKTSFQNAIYKLPSKANIAQVIAYSHYAKSIAQLILKSTSQLARREYPKNVEEIENQYKNKYKSLSLENLLEYVWSLGIRIIPLSDTGVFHGASWNINGIHVIIVKQRTDSHARWIFDLLHELYHVFAHLEEEDSNILEFEEISPFSNQDDKEVEANTFANHFIFKGREEDYAQMCVEAAAGKVENLKNAVLKVAQRENIEKSFLANYLAFRLQKQGENWWGTANNLQVNQPDPFEIICNHLHKHLNKNVLSKFESSILDRALVKI